MRSRAFPVAAVAVPVALLAVLGAHHIGVRPFWRDEAFTVLIADAPTGTMLSYIGASEINMSPYYVLAHLWLALGSDDEGYVRTLSLILALTGVGALAAFAGRWTRSWWLGLAAGLLLAGNAFLLDYAQEARGYTLTVLLAIGSWWAFAAAILQGGRRRWAVYGVVTTLLLLAQVLAAAVLVAQLAAGLLARVDRRALVTGLAPPVLVAGALVLYAVIGAAGQADWIQPAGVGSAASTMFNLAGGGPIAALYTLAGAFVAVALVAELRAHGPGERAFRLGLPLAWVAVAPVLLFVVQPIKAFWIDRYMIEIVPGLAVLAVTVPLAARTLSVPFARAVPAALALLALVVVADGVRADTPFPRGEDLPAAARYVTAGAGPGDVIAYSGGWMRNGLDYYMGAAKPTDASEGRTPAQRGNVLAEELPEAAVAARLRAASRVWVVDYPSQQWHPAPEPVRAVGPAILGTEFRPGPVRSFGDIRIAEFTRAR